VQITTEERALWAKRISVAFDMSLEEIRESDQAGLENFAILLADKLRRSGVIPKLETTLRAPGYRFIENIRSFGYENIFADLKLYGTSKALAIEGAVLRKLRPSMLTVACSSGLDAMKAIREEMPDTELLGVTVPTTFDNVACVEVYGTGVEEAVLRLASLALKAGFNGVIAAPTEAAVIRREFGASLTINAPNIRPAWASLKSDRQNKSRSMRPAEALSAGVDMLIIGDPVILAWNPYDAINHTIDEMAESLVTTEL
jgi:orotidine-5'-phosphate decarboxylase